MKSLLRRKDLLYPELSYKISGILFEVFKEVGSGYPEKYYQRAIVATFIKNKIQFNEQVSVPLLYDGKQIGRYQLDFLIEDAVVLEIKKGEYFKKQNIDQVVGYLKSRHLQLGLIANFTRNGVRIKRIVNLK